MRSAVALLAFAALSAAAAEPPSVLVERAAAAMRSEPERSRALAEQALAAAAASDADTAVRAHLLLCSYHAERDPQAAGEHAARARARLPQAGRAGLRAGVLGCEGELLENAGDNARAMALYRQATAAAEAAGDDEMLAGALFQRGYLRGVQGELALGLDDLRRAMALYERLSLAQQAQNTISGIAILYNRLGDHAQARHYYEASLKIQRDSGQRREEAVTLHNLGRVHEATGDWDAAQHAFEAQRLLVRELAYPRGEAYALRGLAAVDNARGRHAQALRRLDAAARIEAPDERLRAQILLQRGIALRGLRRHADSAAVLRRALDIFRRAESAAEIAASHGELARTLALSQDWRGALEHHEQFKAAADALWRRQLDQRFAAVKVQFDSAAKDKENALLLREQAATRAALAQARRAARARAVALALAAALAVVLAVLAWRHRSASHRMHELALTDELTGLPNRRHLLERLQALIDAGGGAAMIADLDRFKSINDTFGHLVGDDVLRAVALALGDEVREPALVGRLGGEEFAVVLPGADADAARRCADRLRAAVSGMQLAALGGRRLTVSVGATVVGTGDSLASVLKRADDALYAAKNGGRDRTVVVAADAAVVAEAAQADVGAPSEGALGTPAALTAWPA